MVIKVNEVTNKNVHDTVKPLSPASHRVQVSDKGSNFYIENTNMGRGMRTSQQNPERLLMSRGMSYILFSFLLIANNPKLEAENLAIFQPDYMGLCFP